MANRSNGKKVKVRIALAVDCEGNWGCAGGSGMSASDARELATDGCETGFYRIYWITAEVELPRPVEVTVHLPDEAIVEAGQ